LSSLLNNKLSAIKLVREIGRVEAFVGTVIEVSGLHASVGDFCQISSKGNGVSIKAEVVSFRDNRILLMPFSKVDGISYGDEVVKESGSENIPVSDDLLGRVIDPFVKPLDGGPAIHAERHVSFRFKPSNPLNKLNIKNKIRTNIPVIDTLLPLGEGQRIGIFSGSGVGKSSLFTKIALNIEVDVKIIVLIGERGREVSGLVQALRESDELDRSVIIAATSDQPALIRAHALATATVIAEYFSSSGSKVALLADSVTRHALAQREVGLAAGEPPTVRGYPPSVFAQLPSLIERAGAFYTGGSITAIYTVLVEADDLDEPIADNMRAILDGHIILSRKLSDEGVYPPIDPLKSRSRVMHELFNESEITNADSLRKFLSNYKELKDRMDLIGYEPGKDQSVDIKVRQYQQYIDWLTGKSNVLPILKGG
jgi:flagellum-specific ATP synthase